MKAIEPCTNYDSRHSCFDGEPSYVCTGCLNREPIDETQGFVFGSGQINCENFKTEQSEEGNMEKQKIFTVKFYVDRSWIDDGYNITNESAKEMLSASLPYAYQNEIDAKVISVSK